MIGRVYLDPGDRLSGRREPPEPVTVLTKWGPGGGPRNVLVRRADGTLDVIPFPRRLRKMPDPDRPSPQTTERDNPSDADTHSAQ